MKRCVVHRRWLLCMGSCSKEPGAKDPESDKSPSYFSMPFQQRALDCLDRLLTRSSTSHFPPEPVLSEGSLGFDGKGRLRLRSKSCLGVPTDMPGRSTGTFRNQPRAILPSASTQSCTLTTAPAPFLCPPLHSGWRPRVAAIRSLCSHLVQQTWAR